MRGHDGAGRGANREACLGEGGRRAGRRAGAQVELPTGGEEAGTRVRVGGVRRTEAGGVGEFVRQDVSGDRENDGHQQRLLDEEVTAGLDGLADMARVAVGRAAGTGITALTAIRWGAEEAEGLDLAMHRAGQPRQQEEQAEEMTGGVHAGGRVTPGRTGGKA